MVTAKQLCGGTGVLNFVQLAVTKVHGLCGSTTGGNCGTSADWQRSSFTQAKPLARTGSESRPAGERSCSYPGGGKRNPLRRSWSENIASASPLKNFLHKCWPN